MPHEEQYFRHEVTDTYRASARLRVYSAWSAGLGVLLAVGVVGAMIIGWMDASDGFTWLGFALLTGIVAAARFYADATRTIVNAAMLERQMDVGEDLYAGTAEYRRRLRNVTLVGVTVLALSTGAVAVYSVANTDTRTTQDDDDDDERDDDAPGEQDDGGQPAGGSGGGDDENDD
jgi:hypothetical protein